MIIELRVNTYNKTYNEETWVGHGHYHQPINDFFATNLNTKTHTVFSVNSNDLTKKVQTFCLVAMREKEKPTFQSHCIVCVHIYVVVVR